MPVCHMVSVFPVCNYSRGSGNNKRQSANVMVTFDKKGIQLPATTIERDTGLSRRQIIQKILQLRMPQYNSKDFTVYPIWLLWQFSLDPCIYFCRVKLLVNSELLLEACISWSLSHSHYRQDFYFHLDLGEMHGVMAILIFLLGSNGNYPCWSLCLWL